MPQPAAGLFPPLPGDAVADEPQRTAGWRQRDVKRAIEAAGQAGLTSYRIEIGPDGVIAIVVGEDPP